MLGPDLTAIEEPSERRTAASVRLRSRTSSPSHGPTRRTRPSPRRRMRRPTCTWRPRRISRRSGRSGRASGSTGRPRSPRRSSGTCRSPSGSPAASSTSAYNCVDRHVERGLGDKVAYHWIGEPGDTRTLTFRDLQREVSKAANALKELGVETGDRVAIYMPMIPELPIAMLACARIGAPHTVVFGGFSAEALSGRINDCGAKVLITADGGYRRGKEVGLKHHADEALASTPTIEAMIVVTARRPRRPHGPRPRPAGGTTSSTASPRTARRWPSTRSTCCTCSTPRGRRPSPRASCTRPPATCSAPRSATRRSSTSSPTTCTGARPTSAG